MDKEKFEQVLDYFSSNGITLPTDVKNSIEDVFMENDNIESVQCYHSPELEDFQKDLRIYNECKMYLTGENSGCTHNLWTYHGQLQFALSEYTALYDKPAEGDEESEVVEIITDVKNDGLSLVYDPKEYSIILLETVTWDTTHDYKVNRTLELYIYCPEDIPEDDE